MDSLEDAVFEDDVYEAVSIGTDIIVEGGDLLINVHELKDDNNFEESRHAYLVDSEVVSKASAQWKKIVPPKRQDSGHNVIEVTGNIYYHETLLLITHEEFCSSIEEYSEYHFFDILRFTEHWGVSYLVLAWITHWIYELEYMGSFYQWPHYMNLKTILFRLWMVCTLGNQEGFQYLTGRLVKEVTIDQNSNLDYEGKCLSEAFDMFDVPEIPGLIDYVSRERDKKLQELRGVFDEFMDSNATLQSWGQYSSVVEDFLDKIDTRKSLNETFRAMDRIPIYNLTTVEDSGITTFSESQVHGPASLSHQTHYGCNPTRFLRDRLEMVMSSVAIVLDEDHERALSASIYSPKNSICPTESEPDMDTDSDDTLPLVDENQDQTDFFGASHHDTPMVWIIDDD
ncbi:hypothetical protein PG988_005870 [Apiospora saccharicola]